MTGIVSFGKQTRETHQIAWEQIELKLEEIVLLEKGHAFLMGL